MPLLTEHGARCLKDEPGTLEFKVLIPRDDDSKILIYEVYQDDAAFEVHRNRPSIAQWRNEMGMVVKVIATRCTAVRQSDRASLSVPPATPQRAKEI